MRTRGWLPLTALGLALAACTSSVAGGAGRQGPSVTRPSATVRHGTTALGVARAVPGRPLPAPAALVPFGPGPATGAWRPVGRPVLADGAQRVRVVYETTLVPPGGTQPAGIAWMDTGLLAAAAGDDAGPVDVFRGLVGP